VIDGHRLTVRVGTPDEAGAWMVDLPTGSQPIDSPEDLLRLVPAGARVTADFEHFQLHLRRGEDGRPRYTGAVGAIEGPEDRNDERALWALLDRLGDAQAPRACFFYRWSDVESGAGWGNLACLHRHREDYERYLERCAEPGGPRARWVTSAVPGAWVDEWWSCTDFTVRPPGHGYRGRTCSPSACVASLPLPSSER